MGYHFDGAGNYVRGPNPRNKKVFSVRLSSKVIDALKLEAKRRTEANKKDKGCCWWRPVGACQVAAEILERWSETPLLNAAEKRPGRGVVTSSGKIKAKPNRVHVEGDPFGCPCRDCKKKTARLPGEPFAEKSKK